MIHAPIKIRTEDCKRLKINKKLVTGAIIGKAELYEVKKYNSVKEIKADQKFHLASKNFHDRTFGFMLKNVKSFRIPIPCKGQLGFFDVDLPKTKIKNKFFKMFEDKEDYLVMSFSISTICKFNNFR